MENQFRELEVYIGPFKEWKGAKLDKKQSIRLISNGNKDTLKISANIHKSAASFWHTCTLQIYNLSQSTRKALESGLSVNVFAGYEGQEKELVYRGGIVYTNTERRGSDIITTVSCSTAMGGLLLSNTSKTYTQGVSVASIVKELAETIPGVSVDPTNIKISGTIGYAGFSFIGSTKDALDKLAYQYGFTWTIDNDVFVAVKDGQYISDGVILNAANGLRKVSPRIDGLWLYQDGADIEAQYQPNAGLWKIIRVESQLNPTMNKKYACHEISYNLSPKDEAWDMHIVNLLIFDL